MSGLKVKQFAWKSLFLWQDFMATTAAPRVLF